MALELADAEALRTADHRFLGRPGSLPAGKDPVWIQQLRQFRRRWIKPARKPHHHHHGEGEKRDWKDWEYYDDWWEADGKTAFHAYAERMKKEPEGAKSEEKAKEDSAHE